eukprot:7554658-Heterocapsa_arctica.AAC.1
MPLVHSVSEVSHRWSLPVVSGPVCLRWWLVQHGRLLWGGAGFDVPPPSCGSLPSSLGLPAGLCVPCWFPVVTGWGG